MTFFYLVNAEVHDDSMREVKNVVNDGNVFFFFLEKKKKKKQRRKRELKKELCISEAVNGNRS